MATCITRLVISTMYLEPIFLQETAFLNFNFSGMPVADGSFGWGWLVNFSAAEPR